MADKPMRNDELSRRLFSEDRDEAIAGLARRALERLPQEPHGGEAPAWLGQVAAAPPAIPQDLLAAALAATSLPAGNGGSRPATRRHRLMWLWGGGLVAAALAGVLIMRAATPPPTVGPDRPQTAQSETMPAPVAPVPAQVAQAPEAEAPPIPPPPARPVVQRPSPPPPHSDARIAQTQKGTVQAGDWGVMPGRPSLATIAMTPRLRQALAAHLVGEDEGTRRNLVAALTAAGLDLSASPDITRVRIDSALEAKIPSAPPGSLRVVIDGRGGLSLAE